MFPVLIIDGGKEAPNLDVASLDLFMSAANAEEPLDGFANNRIGPRGFGNVVSRVSHEGEFFKKTISRDFCPV
jgi:hypothetical protein